MNFALMLLLFTNLAWTFALTLKYLLDQKKGVAALDEKARELEALSATVCDLLEESEAAAQRLSAMLDSRMKDASKACAVLVEVNKKAARKAIQIKTEIEEKTEARKKGRFARALDLARGGKDPDSISSASCITRGEASLIVNLAEYKKRMGDNCPFVQKVPTPE